MIISEGDGWRIEMTPEEYIEWVKYDESHPHLASIPYDLVLTMFLSHYRRGINLNKPAGKFYEWLTNPVDKLKTSVKLTT